MYTFKENVYFSDRLRWSGVSSLVFAQLQKIALLSLQLVTPEKPVFTLGELVKFRFGSKGTNLRIIQGIHLIAGQWFYQVEWISPGIEEASEVFNSNDCLAWVTDYDLSRV
ncbi:DUF1392 family protein [Nostoc sp. MG11]|uniref:DUF1392 family protein n=1 Tax=Nostoc sp. MG11 TaxID=2721166 RepID=UPI001868E95A|nr:DUF1392 family protein [Nostoc sp. MG11]